ncbi:carbohydrate ABC transporter permease [Micromonospora parathelypteridis]|uniref:Multiple sugar transport system permease protein n=1 Tax=Micromonospora parathelypteridis TaxID=1839617 RepID=A0A840VTI7_9ACTN|nr:carbohydrate ABC transporter permease [Micromonospora parathelypteridis]MBB5479957.1 multiple sugar transport system permease protein [Micromonospora parathelypteridis]GGO25701.1 ABC transporter permease [Micromonospora parathelypteridis]
MSTATVTRRTEGEPDAQQRRRMLTPLRMLLHGFLIVVALVWLFPIAWAVLTSLRSYDYTAANGYVSFGGWTLDNYVTAWRTAEFGQHFLNSVYITVPAVLLTLFLASCVAFVIARFSWKLNIVLLGVFTAANLLPQQALLIPLFRLFTEVPLPEFMSDSELLYDSYWGLILINVAFQCGFCVFVLSNYMKALPRDLYEAAMVDGASIWRQYWQVTMPLCRPALAALATLEVTWIYNEFFWATVLMRTGDKFPVTSSLNNLRGEFFTDNNLVSAGSVLVAIPTLVIFFMLQRHFVRGLTLGASKG